MMNITGVIYVTQNLVNGKIYVGLHTKGRKSYLGSGKYFKRAVRKYGRKNFVRHDADEFTIIEEGCKKERLWIQELNSKHPDGYNLNDGGEGTFNLCPEILVKRNAAISKGQKAFFLSSAGKVAKIKLSTVMKSRNNPTLRPEVRAKINAANSGENHRLFGKHHSEETKIRMRKRHRQFSREAITNMSVSHLGRSWSLARRAAENRRIAEKGGNCV